MQPIDYRWPFLHQTVKVVCTIALSLLFVQYSTVVNLLSFLVLWVKCRTQLSQQMGARKGDIEVKLLLYAIQKTTNFEKALAQKYSTTPYIEKVKHHLHAYMSNARALVCGHTCVCSVPMVFLHVSVLCTHCMCLCYSVVLRTLCCGHSLPVPVCAADHSSPTPKEVFL